jgi:hypothetical protein
VGPASWFSGGERLSPESIQRTKQHKGYLKALSLKKNYNTENKMLDVFDFIIEKGGNPQKIKESQRRRYAPEEAVDEVIALYEDHRKSNSSPRTRSGTAVDIYAQHSTLRLKLTPRSTKSKSKSVRRRRRRRTQTNC